MIRFNHAEITVPRGFVANNGAAILDFVGAVFGFLTSEFPGLDTPSIIFKTDPEASQFIFIAEHDAPAPALSDDHIGFHLDSREDVEEALRRSTAWQAKDPRVEIRDFGSLELTETSTQAFYVRYLLPIWFDVQHIAYRTGFEPSRSWRFVAADF